MIRLIKPIVFVFLIVFAGCSTIPHTGLPTATAIPATFNDSSYTDSANQFSWKQFFTDVYLNRLIDSALVNNYDLQRALQRVTIARQNTRIARAAMLPTVNGVATAGVERYGDYTQNGVGNFDTNLSPNIDNKQKVPLPLVPDYFVGFRSSWEVDVWGKLSDRRRAAYSRYLATEKGRQWLATQVVAEVARLYYRLLALDAKLLIANRNINLQQKAIEIVEAQMSGGRATALAVHQFKAQWLHTRSAAVEISQGIIETENELNALTGRFPAPVNRDSTLLTKNMPQRIRAGIPVDVLLRRPDIQQAELELIAAKADVSAARKAFLPSFTLTPYLGLNAFKLPLLFQPGSLAAGVVGGIAAPLINRVGLKSELAINNAQQAQAFYGYQQNILQGFQEIVTQLKAVENFNKAYELKVAEVKELKDGVANANDLYLAGYATYLEVIIAQSSVLQSEMEQIELKQDSFEALINLFRASGGVYGN